jgi:hypothetical protein
MSARRTHLHSNSRLLPVYQFEMLSCLVLSQRVGMKQRTEAGDEQQVRTLHTFKVLMLAHDQLKLTGPTSLGVCSL